MALTLTNLKTNPTKNRKRVGRGNASGHGTYSTRGLKGQKSRSGVSGLKKLGMKKLILSTPKARGFKSGKPKMQVVSLTNLSKQFKPGQTVNPASLLKTHLIAKMNLPVKILNSGELTVDKLIFANVHFSDSALEKIKQHDGKVLVSKAKQKVEKVAKQKTVKAVEQDATK
jgi:large subunit ribosomal protein L15